MNTPETEDRAEWSDEHRIEVLKLFLSTYEEQLDKRDAKVIFLANTKV